MTKLKQKRILSIVRKNRNKQRRVTIPKEDETLEDGDLVELKKVKVVIKL